MSNGINDTKGQNSAKKDGLHEKNYQNILFIYVMLLERHKD